jgi:hypothetical protein
MRRLPKSLAWTGIVLAMLPGRLAIANEQESSKQACLAASEQGQNERDEGKYRAARQDFLTCARDVCPRVVKDLCGKWLRELDMSAPTIVLEVKDEQGKDLTDVNVFFDGAPLTTVLDGKPLEADAGEHVLHFERDGYQPLDHQIVLRAGDQAQAVTVALQPSRPATAGLPAAGEETGSREPALSAHHVVAASMGLGAVVAVGVGAYFLLQSNKNGDDAARLRNDLAPNACSHGTSPTCQSLSDNVHAQHDDSTLATTLFIGGGVLAVGAVAAWLLWPAHSSGRAQTAAWIAPTQGGAALMVTSSFR